MTDIPPQLDQLFRNRYHGATNIRGIRFQVLYSLLRSFDLYSGAESITLEGIEDVDVNPSHHLSAAAATGRKYIQVKTSQSSWHWSNFKKDALPNFIDAWKADRNGHFILVSNFAFRDRLHELAQFKSGAKSQISAQLNEKLEAAFRSKKLPKEDIPAFLSGLSFEQISESDLLDRLLAAITSRFELETNNAELYLLALVARFLDWAEQRKTIERTDLESVKHFIRDQIDLGHSNPAIQNVWLELLRFQEGRTPDDYYEGTNARPDHILARRDVERPHWLAEIERALKETGACVIRASSGQGKSTLLYRYAFSHYQPETTFVVKHLSEESMVGAMKNAIIAKKTLGLPILVLIDNIRSDIRYWYKLVAELAGENVEIIATVREEDWFRYSDAAVRFVTSVVKPELDLDEARQIFEVFKAKGKLASEITSAEAAYEKVSDRRLLLEYTYLLTHGRMLSERLFEQVREVQVLGEDRGKLHILRLVSVAQIHQAKVETEALLQRVKFDGDPDQTLASLREEYLISTEDGWEGLHLVRSQHLADLLHQAVPIENTIIELLEFLDPVDLAGFVTSVFSDAHLNHNVLLEKLINRCQEESLETIAEITEALFTANETVYFRDNKDLFDEARNINIASNFLLSSVTLPFPADDFLETLREIFKDDAERSDNFTRLANIRDRFVARNWAERTDVRFLRSMSKKLSPTEIGDQLEGFAKLLTWYRLPDAAESEVLSDILSSQDWAGAVRGIPIDGLADLLYNLKKLVPEIYDDLIEDNRPILFDRFRMDTETIVLKVSENKISFEFLVDQFSEGHDAPHEQAMKRLNLLYHMFPHYERYQSQGLYAADFGIGMPVDDTVKNLAREDLDKSSEAHKNAIYGRIVDAAYATGSIFEWQKEWFEYRTAVNELIRTMTTLTESASLGRVGNTDRLLEQMRSLLEHGNRLPKLPESLGNEFKEAQRNLDSWSSTLNNFLVQVYSDDEKMRRLSVINLRDAASKLSKVQDALETVASATHAYFDFSAIDGELKAYLQLADMFEVLYAEVRIDTGRSGMKRFLMDRERKDAAETVDKLRQALAPLEDRGLSFVYPNRLLTRNSAYGVSETYICLGFEILEFTSVLEQTGAILQLLPQIEKPFVTFCLLPLLDGKIYQPSFWRMSQENIQKAHAGETLDGWALLPEAATNGLLTTLPKLQTIEVPEAELIGGVKAACIELHVTRQARSMIMTKLDGVSEVNQHLATLYGDRFSERMQTVVDQAQETFQKIADFSEKQAADLEAADAVAAWFDLVDFCAERFQESVGALNNELTDDENKEFWSNREFDNVLGYYLNIRFGKDSSLLTQ